MERRADDNDDDEHSLEEGEQAPLPLEVDNFVIDARVVRELEDKGCLYRVAVGPHEVFVLGTAHVSDDSVADVHKTVRAVRPNVVVVELCNARAGILFAQPKPEEKDPDNDKPVETGNEMTWRSVVDALKTRQGLSGVFQVLLSLMYRNVSKKLRIMPGSEFKAAVDAVREEGYPCHVVLGDRDVGLTIQRAWALLPFFEKLRLCFELAKSLFYDIKAEDIEKLKQADILTSLMEEFSRIFPSLMRVLVHERDLFLARSVLASSITPNARRVLAVVGLGHAKGIKDTIERWIRREGDPNEECKSITEVPKTPWTARRLMLLLAVLLFALIILLVFVVRGIWRWIF